MKERPCCIINKCDKPALVFMNNVYYCGECVMKYDKINKDRARKEMEEVLNGN